MFFPPQNQQTQNGEFVDAIWTEKNDFKESSEKNFSTFLNTHLSSIHHQKRKKNMRTVLKLKPNVTFFGNNSVTLLNKRVCYILLKLPDLTSKMENSLEIQMKNFGCMLNIKQIGRAHV